MYVGILAVALSLIPFLAIIFAGPPGMIAIILGVSGLVTAYRDPRYPIRAAIAAVVLGSLPPETSFAMPSRYFEWSIAPTL
jgi:uncharacterized membrane protein